MSTLSATDLPFDEAIAYLRQKANVTSQSYLDVWGRAKVKSVTVAGAASYDLEGTIWRTRCESFDGLPQKLDAADRG